MKSTWLACLALIGWGCSGALRNPEPVNLPAAQPAAQPAAAGAPAPATPAAPVSVTKGEPVTPPALQTQAASATVTAPAVGNAQSNAAPTSVAGSPDLIGTVGGQSITVADLLGLWMQRDSLELFRQVKHLIANRMVDLEAARLGIPADPELAERYDLLATDFAYARLIGDRKKIDSLTDTLDHVVLDQSERLERWAGLVRELLARAKDVYVYANNHYAGYAPDTIRDLVARVQSQP